MPEPMVPEWCLDAYWRLRRWCGFTVEQATGLALAGYDVHGFAVLP